MIRTLIVTMAVLVMCSAPIGCEKKPPRPAPAVQKAPPGPPNVELVPQEDAETTEEEDEDGS